MIDNLNDSQSLDLSGQCLYDSDVESLAQTLKGTLIKSLDLSYNLISCNGLNYLIPVLKDTQINKLNLFRNDISDKGVKALAESLKDTQITQLDLSDNYITDEGAKALAESLIDTQIIELNLSDNIIGCDTARYLNEKLSDTKMMNLCLSIGSEGDTYIDQRSYGDTIHININSYDCYDILGIEYAQYFNKTFQNLTITKLECRILMHRDELDDAQYPAPAFINIKINELVLSDVNYVILSFNDNNTQYLVQAFKGSRIATLNLNDKIEEITSTCMLHLSDFLRKLKVIEVDLGNNSIGDEDIKYLVPVLENSDIMHINLAGNNITDLGAKHLSEILPNSKITCIILCDNKIGANGARYLADSLLHSQVTTIYLDGNWIEYRGYEYLVNVFDGTYVSQDNLCADNIKGRFKRPYSILRNKPSIACKICHSFKELVSLNPMTNEFEFIVPGTNTFQPSSDDIDQYCFLIGTLKENPNSKAHIFDMMCKNDDGDVYDFDIMDNINKFIEIWSDKFKMFFDSKLLNYIESLGDYNCVNLVKKFQDMELYDIVQHLLLHRVLYYVDDDQEILHPYIYKMLDKYKMPLYNEQLEPNKREEIISYYQSHKKIDGAEDIIDLL